MNTSLAIIVSSILLAVCLVCGTLLWIRRKEVADYSRDFLSAICFLGSACIIAYLVTAAKGPQVSRDPLLDPMLTFGGLYAISFHSQADIPIVTFRRQAVNDEVHDTAHRLYLRLDGSGPVVVVCHATRV